MSGYYFVISALPPLQMGRPEISFKELKDLLLLNLSKEDLKKLEQLLRPIDLYNIRAFWLGLPLDPRGNFDINKLEEALLVEGMLPSYFADFLSRYESTEERLRYFSSLYVSLYKDALPGLKGFLKKYYEFERALRLVLSALRAKAFHKDLGKELQFEDPFDPLVAEILAQKDAADYIPPQEFEDLKTIFSDNYNSPRKLEEAILHYRLTKIEEMEEPQDFGMDRILAYTERLLLLEDVYGIDKEKGLEQLSKYE